MTHCTTCQSRAVGACANLWMLDPAILSALRQAHEHVVLEQRREITIADLLAMMCSDRQLSKLFQRLGVDALQVRRVLPRTLRQPFPSRRSTERVVLSNPLNALFIACEHGAQAQGHTTVSVETMCATVIHNAKADPAAAVFANFATGLTRAATTRDRSHGVRNEGSAHPVRSGAGFDSEHRFGAPPDAQRIESAEVPQGRDRARHDAFGGRDMQASHTFRPDRMTQSDFEASQPVHRNTPDRPTRPHHDRLRENNRSQHDADLSARYADLESMVQAQARRLARLESAQQTRKRSFKIRRIKSLSQSRAGSQKRTTSRADQESALPGVGGEREKTRESNRGERSAWQARDNRTSDRGGWQSSDRDRQHRNRTERSTDHGPYRESGYGRSNRTRSPETSAADRGNRDVSEQNGFSREPRAGEQHRDPRRPYERSENRSQRDYNRDDKRDRVGRNAGDTRGFASDGHQKKEKKFYLALEDDIVDAPSIGPKTAARLIPIGVNRVRDLLALNVDVAAAQLNVRHITADVLRDWQDQARLVCTVPWLRGTHAQLLVGADYRSAAEIASADLGDVLAAILRFATTAKGERVLRSNPPPEREKIENWIGFAKQADVSRAA